MSSSMSGDAWVFCESPHMQDFPARRTEDLAEKLRAFVAVQPRTFNEARRHLGVHSELTVWRMVAAHEGLDVETVDHRRKRIILYEG